MGQFAALAANGEFAVNERGGQALLKAIRNLIEWIDDQQVRSAYLQQIAKLGTSNNAQVMQPFLQNVASDGSGFITQLQQLRTTLIDAEAGIRQAMANYQHADGQAADKLR